MKRKDVILTKLFKSKLRQKRGQNFDKRPIDCQEANKQKYPTDYVLCFPEIFQHKT